MIKLSTLETISDLCSKAIRWTGQHKFPRIVWVPLRYIRRKCDESWEMRVCGSILK